MQAGKKIAVAGATGRVGRHVVDVLEAGGHDVVAMSRSRGVDVITRDGLAEALAGTPPSPARRSRSGSSELPTLTSPARLSIQNLRISRLSHHRRNP
jgi:glutamate dehydrogenase/leucine dehydrogenase